MWLTEIECDGCGECYEGDGAAKSPRLCYGCQRAQQAYDTNIEQMRRDLANDIEAGRVVWLRD